MNGATSMSAHPKLLHEQVAQKLRRQVQQLPEGTKVPTEAELMDQFGVSRTTIRRAVDAMVSEGLLVRRPPKGTFVARPPFRHALDHPGAFLDTLMVGGSRLTPSLTTLRWVTGPDVPDDVGDEALYFERFYSHGEQPLAVALVYITQPFAREISRADLEQTPSYEVFTAKLGIPIDRTDATINVTDADAALAERLGLEPGASLILLHRRMYTDHNQLVQHSRHYLPAQHFELSLTHPTPTDHYQRQHEPPAVLRLVSPTSDGSSTQEEQTA